MDGYRLGGVSSSVLPDDWEWERIAAPVFALGSARGTNRESARVTLEQAGVVGVFAERHRLADRLSALGPHASTAVGLAVGLENPAEPFLRLPETGIQAGLGCRIEDPVDGFDEDPCQALDDYAFWASLQWSL